MQNRHLPLAVATVIAIAAVVGGAACANRSRYCAPAEAARPSSLVQLSPTDGEFQPTEADLVRAVTERAQSFKVPLDDTSAPARRVQALVLSGGGKNGAYTVGILSGWTATGTRPAFDIVTGISTGALIANYAFLGTEYDRQMVESYTNISDRDIYRKRLSPAAILRDAAASSEPLKRVIDVQVDDRVMAGVAQAHLAGRRLYVGTTNIDTHRFVIWDMGAIASSGRADARELYRKVLLASASPPGFFPPVPIEIEVNGKKFTELHVDGGASTGLFLQATMLHLDPEAVRAGRQPLLGSDAYAIVAGKLYADPSCTDRRTLSIGESALRALVYGQTRDELTRIYTLCQLSGMRFHLSSIPEDMMGIGDAMSFNREEMKKLYETGYAAITSGRAWRLTPPGAEPYEQNQPRTGNQFLAPAAK